MMIKKVYLKSRPVCKATFRLPEEAAKSAKSVYIVGEFNGWNTNATPMKRLKNGDFTITLDLTIDREYQFRYLIDEACWKNESGADKYVSSPFAGAENSVVIV